MIAVFVLATRAPLTRRAAPSPSLPPALCYGLSYVLLFEAFYRGRVSVVSPIVATESLWGVTLSWLVLRKSEPSAAARRRGRARRRRRRPDRRLPLAELLLDRLEPRLDPRERSCTGSSWCRSSLAAGRCCWHATNADVTSAVTSETDGDAEDHDEDADEPAAARPGHDVPVADRRHRLRRPPERDRRGCRSRPGARKSHDDAGHGGDRERRPARGTG